MAGEFRMLTPEEIVLCRENGIDPEGKTVVMSNSDGIWLMHHKTRDELHIRFGEKRAQKNAVPVTAQG